jgi:hypothetical protein
MLAEGSEWFVVLEKAKQYATYIYSPHSQCDLVDSRINLWGRIKIKGGPMEFQEENSAAILTVKDKKLTEPYAKLQWKSCMPELRGASDKGGQLTLVTFVCMLPLFCYPFDTLFRKSQSITYSGIRFNNALTNLFWNNTAWLKKLLPSPAKRMAPILPKGKASARSN